MVAYRIIEGISIIAPRSFCLHCKKTIAWYDLIPLASYLILRGHCRHCNAPISWLYPAIELLTILVGIGLYELIDPHYWISYIPLFSALIITVRTDFETMLISRYTTLFLIPAVWAAAAFGMLPVTLAQSIFGTCAGYLFLLVITRIFYWISGKEGMGQGDLELLAFIGSFTGFLGCWAVLVIGSMLGSLYGFTHIALTNKPLHTKIPFGPFLAIAAIIYVAGADRLLMHFIQ